MRPRAIALFQLALLVIAPTAAAPAALAAEPVLFFSDLTVAPKTGLGDGLGEGAIVTVWGANLGSAQGTSTVTCGGTPAAHVYSWGNADGGRAAGPADLYTSHRMQAVAFSISAAAADGPGSITVTVGGVTSNALPITVGPTGRIFHVSAGGSDATGDGSWAKPWRSLEYVGCGAGTACRRWDNPAFQPGSAPYVVYVGDGVQARDGFVIYDAAATADAPIAVIAYPGASVVIGPDRGIANYNAANRFWTFAKLAVRVGDVDTGIGGFEGLRLVANEVANAAGGCADGMSGAIAIPGFNVDDSSLDVGSELKALGTYIHDWGCDTTSKLEHTFYMANRSGHSYRAFELGWNHLRDNKAHSALHVYDEGTCGDFTGTVRIHDNVVVNQVGMGVDVNTGGSTHTCFSMPVEVYNNLFVNVGLEVPGCENGGGHTFLLSVGGVNNRSHIKFYNNTAYTYGLGHPGMAKAGYGMEIDFAGDWDWTNNIVVDTLGVPFTNSGGPSPAPAASLSNLWWTTASTPPPSPSFDPSSPSADPLFAEASAADFRPIATSPAVDTGSGSVAPIVERDLAGTLRPLGRGFDVGAYEFVRACDVAADCIDPPPCRGTAGATCNDGTCTYPALADGMACADDSDPCTEDACHSGSCTHAATQCVDGGSGAGGAAGSHGDGGGCASFPAAPAPLLTLLALAASATRRRARPR